jgi:LPXTG-motif cell wall-anchored protein
VDENDEIDLPYVIEQKVHLGYYLVGSTMGTLASLDTTNKNVTIHEKNDEPVIEKDVHKKGSDALKAPTAYTGGTDAENTAAYRNAYYGTTDWVQNTDANVGDYVQFRVKIRAQQGMEEYRLHDVMEQGLSFVNDPTHPVVVKLVRYDGTTNGKTAANPLAANISKTFDVAATGATGTAVNFTNYTVYTPNDAGTGLDKTAYDENADFIIQFNDASGVANGNDRVDFGAVDETVAAATASFEDIKDDDFIFVYYWAQLNSSAAIFGNETEDSTTQADIIRNSGLPVTGAEKKNVLSNTNGRNDNYAILTYGKANEVTTWTDASVTTYGIDLVKTEEGTTSFKLLAGAKFNLYKATKKDVLGTGETADFTYTTGSGDSATNTYFVKDNNNPLKFNQDTKKYLYDTNGGTDIETVGNAETYIRGLEAGTYLLEEILAPAGYDKLAYPIAIVINPDANNNGTSSDDSPVEGTFTIYQKTNKNMFPAVATITNWNAGITINGDAPNQTYTYNSTYDFGNGSVANGGLQVINTTGTELPSTGGMGTTVLYIVGGMLVILAGAYLFFSRKRTA